MFGIPSGIAISGPGSPVSSNKPNILKSATSHNEVLFGVYNSNSSITTVTSNTTANGNGNHSYSTRNGSISSVLSGGNGPPSPTSTFNPANSIGNNQYYRGMNVGERGNGMASLAEEEVPLPYIQMSTTAEDYRQCLQWLQQTCRPVFMKELVQLNSVPVPITPANAKHPNQIGGTQLVQIASWKQSPVQILPIDRWGQAHDVFEEIQALHRLRKCRQIIQLYGYLPNASLPNGQMPALLLQQPSFGSLRQFLDHHFDSIQWPERYKLALDMTQGLRYLTSQGISCTLNSGSVLVDGEGVAVLTGFGTENGMIANAPCQMTAQPSSAALVVYTAPERLSAMAAAAMNGQGASKQARTPDCEVFSLGILLWELSSGRMPFEEIIARAEAGPRLAKNMEQLSSAIVKGLREETIPGTPEIYEQLFKMCWDSDAEARPPLEVVEETLQMLVVVEPMDMLMLPDDEMNMHVSTVLSDSVDNDSVSSHNTPTRSNSIRSISPIPGYQHRHTRPNTLHEAIAVSNADMTEWYILSGHDINGYAIVPTFSLECEITPILTCLGHFLPTTLPILKELMDQDVDLSLLCRRSHQNGLHVLLDRYIPFKNENGSAHLMEAVDILLRHVGPTEMDINGLDISGNTPLHLLMRNPRISSEDVAEILKKMMVKGADTTRHAPRDGNVLVLAAKYLHFEACRHILANDILASEPESIEKAVEACMTMTGRTTDKFVNLRTKTRELFKLWTGSAGIQRREKVVLKILQEAGQVDQMGVRKYTNNKGKPTKSPSASDVSSVVHSQAQLDCANRFYEAHIKKKLDQALHTLDFRFAGIGLLGGR
ncbi:hypothetical protein FBU30_000249 [Linnemannia zychae]|nr:hypothetical protein FBU30_000249 [Linnemannia zychae]